MASLSNAQHAQMNVISDRSMTIKPRAMDLNQEDLKLLVEQIIDFNSFSHNGYDLWSFFRIQEWAPIFEMRNGPNYPHLVKNFWVRAEVFDEVVAYEELRLLVVKNSSLKGDSGEEVGLKKF
ncbi:unnamed protein product [Lathyrus oleraceus]